MERVIQVKETLGVWVRSTAGDDYLVWNDRMRAKHAKPGVLLRLRLAKGQHNESEIWKRWIIIPWETQEKK